MSYKRYWWALAIVIIGGLVSATLLTLMVLPTLYLVIEKKHPSAATERPL